MGDAASWAGVVIAVASMIVSIMAMVKSLQAQREANAAQRRIVEIEEHRDVEKRLDSLQAKLQPQLRKTGTTSYRLYLVNNGLAEARNIRVRMDGVPLAEHGAGGRGEGMPSIVGPAAEASCFLPLSQDCHPLFEVEVQWDDDSGTGRAYRTTLTF